MAEGEPTEKTPEIATDREFTDFLIRHIENPCPVKLDSGVVKTLRNTYIRAAKEALPKMTDPEAIRDLENAINIYSH